jgi:hypothetical protein
MSHAGGTASTEQILAEIVDVTTPPMRQPGDFTMGEYIERWNAENAPHRITTGAATRWLDDLIADGELVKVERLYDPDTHRYVNVYRKARGDLDGSGQNGYNGQ